jgi:hypothetical protein
MMAIRAAENKSGNQWEIFVQDFVKGAFVLGDKVLSKFSEEARSADAGHVVVIGIDNVNGKLLVDGGHTGWTATAMHVLFRKSSCDCICHTFDEGFGQ